MKPASPKVAYSHSRLCFKANVIESLKSNQSFRVKKRVGTFQMTKTEFSTVFDNVVQSRSYRLEGIYHYPTVPKKALPFLVGLPKAGNAKQPGRKQPRFPLPKAIEKKCTQSDYTHWLYRKAAAHVRRDCKRGNLSATTALYRQAIHEAVSDGGDKDAYTGLPLRWDLIRKYDNQQAKSGARKYKRLFADLPTVDHVDDGLGSPDFKICSWQVNDCKSDLTHEEFLTVCRQVLAGAGRT